ncbi:MAG TPA: 3-methyl-2-oxobutanoate hydroxymethyltransferase [Phycisphaerae bacterium]|nr:3-methyl-2-oxobutanoate hydroxymethyltransferase [Phycisphaerales bacterium]HRX84473.1 3-methyl-2-oxobutanoate hydroxymethyltransferase [Phycisphaerae bacterium]
MQPKTKVTLATLQSWKRERRKFPVLTCYDYTTSRLMAEAGVDVILVGDTYGEVCLGHTTTLPVKIDHLLTVTEAVRRGAPHAFVIGDMPYLTYQVSATEAIRNAGRFMAEAGCDAVKLEVDRRLAGTVEALATASIPVIAHLGLKPQSIHAHGGYRAQGKDAPGALDLVDDAALMESAGAVALLLEAVPIEVAELIAQRTTLPVIGCVAGPHCDGTVVVLHDMLGYSAGHPPRSVKRYANLHEVLTGAFREYVNDIVGEKFPTRAHGVAMPAEELEALHDALAARAPGEPGARARRTDTAARQPLA